jgi:hypothetical protein
MNTEQITITECIRQLQRAVAELMGQQPAEPEDDR